MNRMFYKNKSFNQNIGEWDVSNVTDMSLMFAEALVFNQNISRWDVGMVTNMKDMFYITNEFNQDIGDWNVKNVTNMLGMFFWSKSFNQDISRWDVGNVENMSIMFKGARAFNQDIGNWNVSKVTNMLSMFEFATLSSNNYNNLLIGWAEQILNNGVEFSGGNSMYSPGEAADARKILTETFGWTITDGGENTPTVSTHTTSEITSSTVTSGGNVTAIGGSAILSRGVVWHTSENPTIIINTGKTSDGAGSGPFTSKITELTANTTYYIRAYATNANGTKYGSNIEFKTKKELTVTGTFTADSKIYDGTVASTINANNLTFIGIAPGETVTFSPVFAFIDKNIGDAKVIRLTDASTIGGEDADKYTLSLAGAPTATAAITAKELIVINAVASEKVYDGSVDATISGGRLSGVIGAEVVSLNNKTSGSFSQAKVGADIAVSTAMTLTGADAGNYKLTQPNDLTANITTLKLSIGGTFSVENKVYDGTRVATIDQNNLLLQTPVVDDDISIINLAAEFVRENAGKNVPVRIINAEIDGVDKGNYLLSFDKTPIATATIIAKELTVINAVASNKVYTGGAFAKVSGAKLSGVIGNDNILLNNSTYGQFTQVNVGSDIPVFTAMTLFGSNVNNYMLTQPTGLTADITPKELSIGGTFSIGDKVYDGTVDATINQNNLTLNTPVSGDFVSLINIVTEFTSKNAGENISVSINNAELDGDDKGNYMLSLAGTPTAKATIIAKELTVINATASNKVYNGYGSAIITGAVLSGVIGDDDILLNNSTYGQFTQVNVGSDIAVVTAMSLSGPNAKNYKLTQPTGLTADISAIELTISGTFSIEDKVYDGTRAATIAENMLKLNTPLIGDVVSLINVVTEFASENAGEDVTVSISDAELGGFHKENYLLSLADAPTTKAKILEKSFTVTFTITNKMGALSNAIININGQSLTTNTNGIATIELKNGVYSYSVSTLNHKTFNGLITVAEAVVDEDVSLINVGINASTISDISIYPNPFCDKIHISNANNARRIVITDITGKVVLNQAASQVIKTDLPSGIYLITITTDNGKRVVKKIIRE